MYLTLEPDEWTGPGPAPPDGTLELQVAELGEPQDGWVPVVQGWRYGSDTDIAPADGVWVATDALPGSV